MLALTVKIGQVVTIGDGTTIKLARRPGQSVRLIIDSDESPIRVREDGVMPDRRSKAKPVAETVKRQANPPRQSWGITGVAQPA
ncbi:carbon storage regulator [Aerococcus mictus]|uniref:carbon storage regulator n=1 Tax=Aerococcus mictus TaxID=2976810 RepID=UPI000DCEA43F|nr:hypothetical protein DBT53_13065 [Aerococcus mictus]RAV90740.1 hypothetical protein DBT45_10210 [Aerococcus tenax]RAV94289.1 hypothetical protein DBT41_15680 [Aerococcus urinae]